MHSKNKAVSILVLVAVIVLVIVVLALVVNPLGLVTRPSIQSGSLNTPAASLPVYKLYFLAGRVPVMEAEDRVILEGFHSENMPTGTYDLCTQMDEIEGWLSGEKYDVHDSVEFIVEQVKRIYPQIIADGMCRTEVVADFVSNGSSNALITFDGVSGSVECGASAPACNGDCPPEKPNCTSTGGITTPPRACKCAWSGGQGTACPSSANACPTTQQCASQTIETPHCHVTIKYNCYVTNPRPVPATACICVPAA